MENYPITFHIASFQRILLCGTCLLALTLLSAAPGMGESELSLVLCNSVKMAAEDIARQFLANGRVAKLKDATLVIAPFEGHGFTHEEKRTIIALFQDKLGASFILDGKFKVVERSELERVFKELKLADSGIVDKITQFELGKKLGANYLVVGNISIKSFRVNVEANLVNIADGIALAQASSDGNSVKVPHPPAPSKSLRVAVMNLQASPLITYENIREYSAEQMIKELSDMLDTELIKIPRFELIEKSQFTKVLQEHNLATEGFIDPSKAVEVGRLIGVQYIIGGRLTECTLDKITTTTTQMSNNPDATTNVRKTHAVVELQMIDIESGKIIIANKGEGRTGGLFILADLNKSDKELIEQAMRKAIQQATTKISETFPSEFMIICVKKHSVDLSAGRLQGLEINNWYNLYHVNVEKDKAGIILSTHRAKIGQVCVKECLDDHSSCQIFLSKDHKNDMPAEGDIVSGPVKKDRSGR